MNQPDPSRAVTVEDFARCLAKLHIWADAPSLRMLEQKTGTTTGRSLGDGQLKSVRLGRSSLNDVLNGRKFPRKAFLLTFVEACGVDPMTDRRWEEAWNRLASEQMGHDAADSTARSTLEIAQLRARAEQAEAENRLLREQIAEFRTVGAQSESEDTQARNQDASYRPSESSIGNQAAITVPASESEPLRRWDPGRIGPYVVLGRLGAGSMGHVYLGRSAAGRLVAVKTIKVDLAEEAGFRTRFAQEIAAAGRVSGFFTAAVVEADPEADLPWLATAYVPAPSLARLVKTCGPLPAGTVRWLAAGCAEALESIHGAGLVHRDLKPSNVLVAPDGPRVIDFGVARAAERMSVTTSRGTVGTPAYTAPEQARDTHQASAASDVYALGATLLFAATGHPPYPGDSVMDVLARLATEEPDLSGLPTELTHLVAACLQRIPRDRPTSSAILAQLGQFTEIRPGAHSYLPDTAMALIAQYQTNPLLAAGPPDWDSDADATSASYTELPASYVPGSRAKKAAAVGGPHFGRYLGRLRRPTRNDG
jgi:serine/threonine protein kinase